MTALGRCLAREPRLGLRLEPATPVEKLAFQHGEEAQKNLMRIHIH
jgi:hypothetical protein